MTFVGIVAFIAVVAVIAYRFAPARARYVVQDWGRDLYYYSGDLYRRWWRK